MFFVFLSLILLFPLGIGIEADLTTEKTPAVLKAETNRVYVSNLPKDITEEEIGKRFFLFLLYFL